MERALSNRSGGVCEISGVDSDLTAFLVGPKNGKEVEDYVLLNQKLADQLKAGNLEANDWKGLNDSVWNEHSAVKVLSYRALNQLKGQAWADALLDQMYLTDEEQQWADAQEASGELVHLDSNGVQINQGDTVVLIKDLDVKGSSIVAKRGTAVRNVRLVHDDPTLIEGKVDGQSIYILTKFTKK